HPLCAAQSGRAVCAARLSPLRGARRRAADPHAPVSAANQREGGALHSDADSPVGLRRALCQLVAPYAGAAALAASLQSRAAARGPRLSTTLRPLSEACAVNNLVRIHT